MKKILVLGSTGFIGKNILPLLQKKYDVTAPTRAELDLLDFVAVEQFLKKHSFDAVVNLASPTGQNIIDNESELFERTLRVFTSLERCAGLYGKMIYIGSGAEYGKHRAISNISEEAFGEVIPKDQYGFARYIMSKMAERHDNIVNLRLFACHGLYDPPHKLIPHIISCIKAGRPIELKQDVVFDFLYVMDIFPVLEYFIENLAKHKAYNLCSGEHLRISYIAEGVKQQLKSSLPVTFSKFELGLEYSASNIRIRNEISEWNVSPVFKGVTEILNCI